MDMRIHCVRSRSGHSARPHCDYTIYVYAHQYEITKFTAEIIKYHVWSQTARTNKSWVKVPRNVLHSTHIHNRINLSCWVWMTRNLRLFLLCYLCKGIKWTRLDFGICVTSYITYFEIQRIQMRSQTCVLCESEWSVIQKKREREWLLNINFQ